MAVADLRKAETALQHKFMTNSGGSGMQAQKTILNLKEKVAALTSDLDREQVGRLKMCSMIITSPV